MVLSLPLGIFIILLFKFNCWRGNTKVTFKCLKKLRFLTVWSVITVLLKSFFIFSHVYTALYARYFNLFLMLNWWVLFALNISNYSSDLKPNHPHIWISLFWFLCFTNLQKFSHSFIVDHIWFMTKELSLINSIFFSGDTFEFSWGWRFECMSFSHGLIVFTFNISDRDALQYLIGLEHWMFKSDSFDVERFFLLLL